MLAIYYSIHACNSTRAKTELYCTVGFVSVIEASRSVIFVCIIDVESQTVEFISVIEASKSVMFFSDCPQCNDLY